MVNLFFILDLIIFIKIFSYFSEKTPGIGEYDTEVGDLKNKGKYIISTLRSSHGLQFSQEKRKFININTFSPGPGSYNIPSIF